MSISVSFKHNLGDKASDQISGLTGIIVSRSESLYGCSRYWLQPQDHKDGEVLKGGWFDEDQIEVVEAGVIARKEYRVVPAEPAAAPLRMAGGPSNQPAPHARGDR